MPRRIVFSLLLAAYAFTQPSTGTVSGIVQDNQEIPLANAKVWLLSATKNAAFHAVPAATTDGHGRFTFTGLPFGEYLVNPMKQAEGYPNRTFDIYNKGNAEPLLQISIDAKMPVIDNVVAPLHDKAGIVKGQIVDAVTGQSLSATIRLSRLSDSVDLNQAATGPYAILIPASTPVQFLVTAPGYNDWSYSGDSKSESTVPLVVPSGTTTMVDVRLLPKH